VTRSHDRHLDGMPAETRPAGISTELRGDIHGGKIIGMRMIATLPTTERTERCNVTPFICGIIVGMKNRYMSRPFTDAELDTMWRRYSVDRCTVAQLSAEYQCSSNKIRYAFQKKGFEFRSQSEGWKAAYENGAVQRSPRRGDKSNFWKGGRRITAHGYVDIHMPTHPESRSNGYLFEHRIIWEAAHGPLPDGWHIHHLNGVKDDNRVENLQAMPAKDHARYIAMQSAKIRELELEVEALRGRLDVRE